MRLSLQPSLDPAAYRFSHRLRTRFAETDAMGIIHHGAYPAYLEEARAAMLRDAGFPYDGVRDGDGGVDFAVLELYVRHRRPLLFDDLVTVHVVVDDLTRTTFQVAYLLTVEDAVRATGVTVHGAVDAGGRPGRMPAFLADSSGRGTERVHVSYGLPTHRVDRPEEFLAPGAIGELAKAAEDAGFGAVYTTDHPFPGDSWLAHGGHHTLDPLVALSFAASTTSTILLHTNLFIIAYRNPFLAAKGIATLDVLSGGRTVVGLGAGYLESEFDALGVPFDDRNDRMDEALAAMDAAWSGESVVLDGSNFHAPGNTMLPRPAQHPRPPLWIGGNSRRAIRRAVDAADGWCPFPNPGRLAARTRTAPLESAADLAVSLDYARSYADEVGRTQPLTVCFIPDGLSMGGAPVDEARVVASIEELAAVGVHWVAVALPGDTRDAQRSAIDRFAGTVLASVAGA